MAVEIDEAELAAKNRVLGFVSTALSNPKTRGKVLEIQKELDPNFTAPELEQRAYVDTQIGEIKSLVTGFIDDFKKTTEESRAAADRAALEKRWAEGEASARQRGYSKEGIEHLHAYMEKNGLIDHGIAMAAFERENPLPTPVATGDNRWGFFDAQTTESPDLKPLMEGNEEGFLKAQIAATLREVRSGR